MTRLIKLFVATLLVVQLTACRSTRTVTSDVKRDSVSYIERVVVKDSLIRVAVPADSSMLQAFVECDSMNQAHLRYIIALESGTHSSVAITLKDNVLTADCRCDSFAIYSVLHTRYQETAESAYSYKSDVKQVARSDIPVYIYLLLFALTAISIFLSINTFFSYVKKNSKD